MKHFEIIFMFSPAIIRSLEDKPTYMHSHQFALQPDPGFFFQLRMCVSD